jgi:hypothetical protein
VPVSPFGSRRDDLGRKPGRTGFFQAKCVGAKRPRPGKGGAVRPTEIARVAMSRAASWSRAPRLLPLGAALWHSDLTLYIKIRVLLKVPEDR